MENNSWPIRDVYEQTIWQSILNSILGWHFLEIIAKSVHSNAYLWVDIIIVLTAEPKLSYQISN